MKESFTVSHFNYNQIDRTEVTPCAIFLVDMHLCKVWLTDMKM